MRLTALDVQTILFNTFLRSAGSGGRRPAGVFTSLERGTVHTVVDTAQNAALISALEGFAVLDSNYRAHDLAVGFAEGRVRFGVITGPPGWGKSHLLKAAASACACKGAQVRYIVGSDLARPPKSSDRPEILLVDELELAAHPRLRQRLCIEMERRTRTGRPTLCACVSEAKSKNGFLPYPRMWRREAMSEPSSQEREAILRTMCQAHGLRLSDSAIRVVCRLVRGDGRALQGAVTRLKVGAQGRSTELSPVLAAGLLNPFLEPGGFDLRDLVIDCVSQSFPKKYAGRECRDQACIYIMRERAVLPEESVAIYLGLSPARVFKLQREARCRLNAGEESFVRLVERSVAFINTRLEGGPP